MTSCFWNSCASNANGCKLFYMLTNHTLDWSFKTHKERLWILHKCFFVYKRWCVELCLLLLQQFRKVHWGCPLRETSTMTSFIKSWTTPALWCTIGVGVLAIASAIFPKRLNFLLFVFFFANSVFFKIELLSVHVVILLFSIHHSNPSLVQSQNPI